jgi:hypothetical protein
VSLAHSYQQKSQPSTVASFSDKLVVIVEFNPIEASDMANPDFQNLLDLAEAEFSAWRNREIIPEREGSMAKLHTLSLSPPGRAFRSFEIYRELLEREVRERIKVYGAVAERFGNREMLSKKRLDEHRDRIMTTVKSSCASLKQRIEGDFAAAGRGFFTALPPHLRYTHLESDILDVVLDEIRILGAKGAILGAGDQPMTDPKDVAAVGLDNEPAESRDIDVEVLSRSRTQGSDVLKSNAEVDGRLSDRDTKIHETIGAQTLKTLANTEIMRDRLLCARLRREYGLKSRDAVKSCLDRIRKAKQYPLSGDIKKKRSTKE